MLSSRMAIVAAFRSWSGEDFNWCYSTFFQITGGFFWLNIVLLHVSLHRNYPPLQGREFWDPVFNWVTVHTKFRGSGELQANRKECSHFSVWVVFL